MLLVLLLHLALAVGAPLLLRRWGPRAFHLLALAPVAAVAWAVAVFGTLQDGGAVVEEHAWVPALGLDMALRVTTLPWLMVLLVGGIGVLVLYYCAGYFDPDEPELGRFAACLVGFCGAMLGLVVSDNLILLYVFWELTTVFSYLLIGHHSERRASRLAAAQAFIVTTGGGLAMLVGFLMLGQHAGTYRVSQLVAAPWASNGFLAAAAGLVLVGALAKSAIFPLSFWLPGAMAAPTPVSAYLHAAAMVKAGVYLVALLAPALASVATWRPVLYVAGGVTMLAGGWAALRQNDLKMLLAYGTVSQLGLLMVVMGAGTHDAALAGAAMLLAHALFKAALFLVVGIIDHGAGTRDLSRLSGLWRRMPTAFAAAVVAAASMAGVPVTLGFVAKEAVFAAFRADPVLLSTLVAGTVLTVAYSLLFVWGAFADKRELAPTPVHRVGLPLLAPVALLAGASVLAGVLAEPLDRVLAPYARRFGPDGAHLALWHGLTPELGLSAVVLLAGGVLLALRRRGIASRLRAPINGAATYRRLTHWLDRFAVRVTFLSQRGSLPQYLGTILVVLVAAVGGTLLIGRPWPAQVALWASPVEAVIGLVFAVAAVFAVRTRRRLVAVILVGVTGYCSALIFAGYGAPDLALVQVLIETVSIVAFVLVLRRLPAAFSARALRRSRWGRPAVALLVGLVMFGTAIAVSGAPQQTPVSADYPHLASQAGSGQNVVNVAVVDIRAWDTLGEISALLAAATGVASLIFQLPRGHSPRRRQVVEPVHGHPERIWLRAGPPRGAASRTIVFEVVTRLLFHTVVLFSVFLMFSGHNRPGGGFAGGLVVGLALTVRYLAGGRDELDEAAPMDAGLLLGAGLSLSVLTGVAGLVLGDAPLRSATVDLRLPVIGDVHLVTSLFVDIGVYLIVVGLVLSILRSLGAEVDRQIEAGIGPVTEDEKEPSA